MSQSQSIPAIVIGVHRSTAIKTADVFEGTPYHVAAVLDLTESPSRYQYTQQNLGAVLYALHPRPQIMITGTAVANIVPEVQSVWDEYVHQALKPEAGDWRAAFVPVGASLQGAESASLSTTMMTCKG